MKASFRFYFFMKYGFLFLFGFLTVHLQAQTSFTGKIVYNLHTPKEKTDASLIVYFGQNRLRLEFAENGQNASKDYVIVALDEGTVTTLDSLQKSYRIKNLRKETPERMQPKTIAGHRTSPVKYASGWNGLLGGFFGQTIFQVADDLYYPIPEAYKNNPEVMMVQNGRVVLGAEIKPVNRLYDKAYTAADSVDAEKDVITAEATEVVSQQMDPALFQIPAGFTAHRYDDYKDSVTDALLDTVATTADTTPPKPLNKKKKAPAKNGSISKPSATRRKDG